MIGGDNEVSILWGSIGTAIAAAIAGAVGFFGGRKRREAEGSAYRAETVGHQAIATVIDQLREEVKRLSLRVTELERERRSDRSHIYQLELAMIQAGLNPQMLVPRVYPDEE